MTSQRSLFVAPSLLEKLHAAQIDAWELAACDLDFITMEANPSSIKEELKAEKDSLLIIDPVSFLDWVSAGRLEVSPQLILCCIEKEYAEVKEHPEQIQGIRYLIAAHLPAVMRATLGSILEYHVGATGRGLGSRLFQTESMATLSLDLRSSAERAMAQDKVMEFFNDQYQKYKENFVAGTSSFPKNLSDVLDELLMNAFWDACPERMHIDRTKEVVLAEHERVRVEAYCDGMTLCLSVEDSYGTFPPTAILRPIRWSLGIRENTTVNEEAAGAGIGLYMILQKMAFFTVDVNPNKSTRASVFLRADVSLKETQKRPRTVLYFGP